MIGILTRYNNQFGFTMGNGVEQFDCDNVGLAIHSYIRDSHTETSDGKPGRSVLFVQDLDLIGGAILAILQDMGYKDSTDIMQFFRKTPKGTYQTIIGADMGTWYAINIYRMDGYTVSIYSLENVTGQITNATILREKIDGETDIECICRVCWGVIETLSTFTDGKTSLTISSWAMRRWSDEMCIYDRGDVYPDHYKIDCDLYGCNADEYIRHAYAGGWCYDNSNGKEYHNGITLDVNSLYPYVMLKHKFPVCQPHFHVGDIPEIWQKRIDDDRAMAFIHFSCRFEVKKGYLPFIMIPGDFMRRGPQSSSVIQNSAGSIDDPVEMVLTHWEYELFKEHYNIKDLQIFDCCVYQTQANIFRNYVSEFHNIKKTARATGDKVMERVGKSMLNNLSGGFAKKKERANLLVDAQGNERGIIMVEGTSKSMIPIGACITSYARCYIVRVCQANYDRFLYSDTDSAHLIGTEPPKGIDIGGELGQMKIERIWKTARFYGQKTYIEQDTDGYWHLTYAGVPSEVQAMIEHRLDGLPMVAKYLGQEVDFEDIEKNMEREFKYSVEIPNGTFKPTVEPMKWKIGLDRKKESQKAKIKYVRNINKVLTNVG